MKIAVLMKPVLDCGVPLTIDDTAMAVAQKDQSPHWVVNPADRSALEVALHLTCLLERGSVHAVSYVPAERTESIHYALACGADAGTVIVSNNALEKDAAFASIVLSTYLARQPFDMILCGNESIDTGMACMGPFIAERLRLPQLTRVVSLDLSPNENTIVVQRRLEKGNREKLECHLPAVVAVDPMIASPRYASVYALNNAAKRSFESISLDWLGIKDEPVFRTQVQKLALPRPRPKRTFIPDAKLSAAERMKLIRSGGVAKKKKDGDSLTGSPEQIADGIVSFLQEKGFLE